MPDSVLKTFEQLQTEYGESTCGRSTELYFYQYFEKELEKLRIQYDAEFEAFKMSFRNRSIRRLNMLEEWLTEYRDQLKKENAFHKNTGIINAINELLDVTNTDIQ